MTDYKSRPFEWLQIIVWGGWVGSCITISASFLVKTILRASYLKYVLIIICVAILFYLLVANFLGARTVL